MHYTATPADHEAGTLPKDILREIHEAIDKEGYALVSGLVSQETRDLLLPSILLGSDKRCYQKQ